jgi:hypothetical protein
MILYVLLLLAYSTFLVATELKKMQEVVLLANVNLVLLFYVQDIVNLVTETILILAVLLANVMKNQIAYTLLQIFSAH